MQETPQKRTGLCREWDNQDLPAAHVRREVQRILKERPQVFENETQKCETLQNIEALDKAFEKNGGDFFHISDNAFATARAFTDIHIERYHKTGRPSLPALAIHHAEHMSLDRDSADYKALLLVAIRAELQAGSLPDYHNKFHYLDVAAMTANLLEKNDEKNRSMSLTKHEKALTLIAAIGHDLDHHGTTNPDKDPVFNEDESFRVMKPLLAAAGLSAGDISKIFIILMTTSPNGPHAVLKAAAHAQRNGVEPDYSKADPENEFLALQHVLALDPRLTQMAAIVSDSDLYASSGAGPEANRLNSKLMSAELHKDLTTAKALLAFLNTIVGEDGYASAAGRAVAGPTLEALRRDAEYNVAKDRKPAP